MDSLSPPESVHALDLTGLQRPEVTFWTARAQDQDGELMGCGALCSARAFKPPTGAEGGG